MRCRISTDASFVTATVAPRRSLWILLCTPFCVLATALHLLGATPNIYHAVWLALVGVSAGILYLWLFLWNLFDRQQIDFEPRSVTATSNMLGWRRVQSYPAHQIQQITYIGYVPQGESTIRLLLNDRSNPVAVLSGLNNSDAEQLLHAVALSFPHLSNKISTQLRAAV